MANLNKVMLIGNLTRDPQLRYTPNQTAVVEFGLATNRKYKGSDGQLKEDTCFVDCVAFAKPAETINKYLNKGSSLFVEGRLTFDSWTAQDGSKRSRLRVTVENFQFLGSPSRQNNQGYSQNTASNNQNQGGEDFGQAPMDDDIPF